MLECVVNFILNDLKRRSIWLSLLSNNISCLSKHKSTIVLLYERDMLCIFCHFAPFKPLTLQLNHVKLIDILTSLPERHSILIHVVWFVSITSLLETHVTCYISISWKASVPIRRCLFIDYIMMLFIKYMLCRSNLSCMSPESACSLGPLLAHKRNIILMALHWWATGGPLYMFTGSQYPVGLDL